VGRSLLKGSKVAEFHAEDLKWSAARWENTDSWREGKEEVKKGTQNCGGGKIQSSSPLYELKKQRGGGSSSVDEVQDEPQHHSTRSLK